MSGNCDDIKEQYIHTWYLSLFFTRTHFKSWKFYTRKMRKFTTKLPKTVFFWFFWNFFTLSQNFYTHGVRSVRDKYQVWIYHGISNITDIVIPSTFSSVQSCMSGKSLARRSDGTDSSLVSSSWWDSSSFSEVWQKQVDDAAFDFASLFSVWLNSKYTEKNRSVHRGSRCFKRPRWCKTYQTPQNNELLFVNPAAETFDLFKVAIGGFSTWQHCRLSICR